ncbi:MAG TPA: HAMP domain-containing sensor histidine kinase [Tahibacter sp.]|uniref:sensor histidine kinase n=1 Tax=Tahibacter sp. TaxID=2056211 RepID=UPI002C12A05C|nr:HAMP domain-containing sensor histidine kinase [Tahibacter sp.]HSX59408.1 HAMP domain-containing sensor histidine kinase [Tahibacter sp.]
MTRRWLRTAGAFALAFLSVSALYWFLVDPHWLAGRGESGMPGNVRAQALFALLIGTLSGLLAWLLERRAHAPLRALQDELQRLDPGNVLHRLRPPDAPELHALAGGINDLLSRVHVALGQLDRFAAQVAHELRLPLTLARLRLDQAAPDLPDAVADELVAELERLTQFVDKTLLLAKAEQGNLPLKRVRVDLRALLARIAEGIALMAEAEDRTLELDDAPAWIAFDADYTKQIVYNLLANALRHGSGRIRVRLRTGGTRVRLVVVNDLRAIPARQGSLGSGQRMIAALAALHRGMHVRYRSDGHHYLARVVVDAAAD